MKLSSINWGDDSAEKDPYLLNYFVQSPAFGRLQSKQKNLVIGRKGAGKSAVRKKLEQTFSVQDSTYVINLSPKFNAIRNILNDKDLAGGFGQEIFFQHTWIRQVLLDCLCVVGHNAKGRYAKDSVEFARQISLQLKLTSKDFVENISDILSRMKAKAGSLGEFGLTLERELRDVAEVEALEHHFKEIASGGAKFVILIDDLDLGWNNSDVANNLLLGLLAAVNYLSALSHNIFPLVFLREDVYEILITKTQHSDKYRNVERIRWSKHDLLSILSERIDFNLAKNGYPEVDNSLDIVFPLTVGTNNLDNWLNDRTLGRPRELIQLARYYTESVDSDQPDAEALKASEQGYSEWKLADLCAEYSNQYPGLVSVFSFWKTKYFRSKYHLKSSEINEMLLSLLAEVPLDNDWFNEIADEIDIRKLLQILYEIGFIGDFVLGGDGGSKTVYSYQGHHEPRFEEIQIHPCFRRAVGTVERIRASGASSEAS